MVSKALSKLKDGSNAANTIRALEVMARARCATQDALKASKILKEYRDEFRQKGDKNNEVVAFSLEAECCLSNGDIEAALSKVAEGLELAVTERNKMGEAAILRVKSKILIQKGSTDEAITVGKTVAHILKECRDFEGQAIELLSVAESLHWLAQYDECITTAKQSVKIFRNIGHRHGEANALRLGADAAWAHGVLRKVSWQGDDEGALPMATAALESYKEAGIVDGQLETGSMIAQVLLQMGEYEESLQMCEETHKKAMEAGNRAVAAETLKTSVKSHIGRIDGRRSTATQKTLVQWGDNAVQVASALEGMWVTADKASQSEAQYIKGSALLARGQVAKEANFQNAVAAADKSVQCAREAQVRKLEAAALVLKAEIHFAMAEINPAADALERAGQIYKEDMDVDGHEKGADLLRKFRASHLWAKRKPKLTDGKAAEASDIPLGATGLDSVARGRLHVHFDNLRGRAAKNIGK
jgi:tetratricopeptide (TPR) repeat protein